MVLPKKHEPNFLTGFQDSTGLTGWNSCFVNPENLAILFNVFGQ